MITEAPDGIGIVLWEQLESLIPKNPLAAATEGDMLPDLDAVPDDVAARAKLMWFCHPHAPSGRCATRPELERVLAATAGYAVFRPQRADHWIAGIQHRFGSRYRLRAEAYFKDYRRLKPRFENAERGERPTGAVDAQRHGLDPAVNNLG